MHNEGHDVESLWWIAVYLLLFNGDVALVDEETPDQRSKRKKFASKIFTDASANIRAYFFVGGTDFFWWHEWLPGSFEDVVMCLTLLRREVGHCLYNFESRLPLIDKTAFDNLYDFAIMTFQGCSWIATGIQIQSYKVLGRKRQKALFQQKPFVASPS